MRKYMKNSVPAPITSFDIDEEGFIYTCSSSQTQEIDTVKKLNAAGYNLFDGNEAIFGDIGTLYSANKTYRTSIVDIEISDDNLINCLDYTSGRIFQYDEDCNLLFIIGSIGEQLGGFKQVSGIESNNDYLYVTDSQKNTVTVFKKTVFGSIVHEATRLYNDGYYDEALEPWYEVLKRDGNYRRAYIGISSALINQGDYKSAMKYAKLAKSQWIYDRAFEGYRTEVINNNFTLISVIILITIVSLIIILVLKKKSIIIKNINSEKGGD
jgi:tetratricopeptide (TPR) repeat protein